MKSVEPQTGSAAKGDIPLNAVIAAKFISSELWDAANWKATTFKWHPSSAAPPIMGIVFQNSIHAYELFGLWNESNGNDDLTEELHVSIIEGQVSDEHQGYIVHIYVEVQPVGMMIANGNGAAEMNQSLVFSRVNRMYPKGGSSALLERFKREYQKHGEYLLAPVTRRGEKEWVDVELGIVKATLHLRKTEHVRDGDVDMVALKTAKGTPPGTI